MDILRGLSNMPEDHTMQRDRRCARGEGVAATKITGTTSEGRGRCRSLLGLA